MALSRSSVVPGILIRDGFRGELIPCTREMARAAARSIGAQVVDEVSLGADVFEAYAQRLAYDGAEFLPDCLREGVVADGMVGPGREGHSFGEVAQSREG